MNRRPVLLAVTLALAAAAATVRAQEPARLTLEEAQRLGAEASQRVVEIGARREAAEAAADQRRAAGLPLVSAQASYTRTNHVDEFGVPTPDNRLRVIYPDLPDNYLTRLALQWPLYTGGRVEAAERASRSEAAALSGDLDAARADLRLDITRAYWALVTADESVRVLADALDRTRALLADVRNQLAAGLVAPNEVLSVEAQQSRQRLLSIQAQVTRDGAEAELGRLAGLAPGTRVEPITALAPPDAADATLDDLIARARAVRPERAALLDRIRAAEERVAVAAAGRRPTVAVGGGVDYGRPNPRIFPRAADWRESWDASVSVSWPIFDGGRTRAEAAEAAATARAVEARLAEFDAAVAVEIRQRLNEARASRAAIEAAADGVRAAAEARRVVGDRFAAGVATSTDVLTAQLALLQAELERTQALAGARLAQARLERALGL